VLQHDAELTSPPLYGPVHPCSTDKVDFDHDWKFQDDSFDHEFGTERVWYWQCERCGVTREMEPGDYYDDFDDYAAM
jgi:hypothetical protein